MSSIELIGFTFGLAGVWLTIKKNVWCFPIGIINVIITAWLVWEQQLFADVIQQMVYFILLIYGWIIWTSGKDKTDKLISTCTKRQWVLTICIILLGSFSSGYFLHKFTQASYPYLDSTGTMICFLAQGMVALKKIENWYLWIIANLLYVWIYWMKDLPLYSGLSGLYLALAFAGLIAWNKKLKSQVHD